MAIIENKVQDRLTDPSQTKPLISFQEPQPPAEQGVSIYAKTPVQLPDDVAKQRAAKWAFGRPEYAEAALKNAIDTGNEDTYRKEAASNQTMKQTQERQNMINDVLKTYDGLPTREMANMLGLIASPVAANPLDIFEKSYAEKVVDTVVQKDPNNILDKAAAVDPDRAGHAMDKATDAIRVKEAIRTRLQNAEAEWAKTSGWSKAGYIAKTFIPGYSNIYQTNAVKEANAKSWLKGNNLEETAQHIYMAGADKGAEEFNKAFDTLWEGNPVEAMDFARSMLQQGTSDIGVGNVMTVADTADVLTTVPIFKLGSIALKGFKGVSRSIKISKDVRRAAEAAANAAPEAENLSEASVDQIRSFLKDEGLAEQHLSNNDIRDQFTGKMNETPPTVYEVSAPVGKRKDGTPIGTEYDPETNVIHIHSDTVRQQFKDKVWAEKDGTPGLTNFPEDYFKTEDQWRQFLINRQVAMHKYPQLAKETTVEYANRLNLIASVNQQIAETSVLEAQKARAAAATVSTVQPVNKNEVIKHFKGEEANLTEADQNFINSLPEDVKQGTYEYHGAITGRDESTDILDEELVNEINNAPINKTKYDEFVKRLDAASKPTPTLDLPKARQMLSNAGFDASKLSDEDVAKVAQQHAATEAMDHADAPAKLEAIMNGVKQEATRPNATPEDIAAGAGNLDVAASIGAVKEISDPNNLGRRLFKGLDSLFNPQAIDKGASRYTTHQVREIVEEVQRNADRLIEGGFGGRLIERMPEEAKVVAVANAKAVLRNNLGKDLESAILDISGPEFKDVIKDSANVTTVHMALGTRKKDLFNSSRKAAMVAHKFYNLPLGSFTIKQQGGGFFIDVFRPIIETDRNVRKALLTAETATPTSITNLVPWLTKVKGGESVLSHFNRGNRHIAVHGITRLNEMIKDVGDTFAKLSPKEKHYLNNLMTMARNERWTETMADGSRKVRRGVEYRTLGEYEAAYFKANRAFPSPQSAAAYFKARQIADLDYVFRNMDIYKMKTRQGIENFRIHVAQKEGSTAPSTWFEGKHVDELPTHDEEAGIIYHDPDTGQGRYFRMSAGNRRDMNALITEGFEIIQVANPRAHPMRKVFGEDYDTVNFVITKSGENKPLDWKQIPRRPGGHVLYTDKHFLKQARLSKTSYGRTLYEGDNTLFAFNTEAKAREVTPYIEDARKALDAGDEAALDRALEKLPWEKEEFKKMFEDSVDEVGNVTPARYSTKEPFRYVGDREGINDRYRDILKEENPDLEDLVDSAFNLYRDVDKEFAGERDLELWSLGDSPNHDNPAWDLTEANELDPLSVLNKSTTGFLDARFMHDYRVSSIESFVREFGDLMDPGTGGMDAVLRNPMMWLYRPAWRQTPEMERLQAAKAAQTAILNLLGTPDEVSSVLERTMSKLQDQVYKNFGQKPVDFIEDHVLERIGNPLRFTQGLAYNLKMSILNPAQYFLQAQTLSMITGIAGPKRAGQGLTGATLMRYALINERPQILNHLAGMATKMGFGTREEFLESFKEMTAHGIHLVGGETVWKNQMKPANIISTNIPGGKAGAIAKYYGKKALSANPFFFEESEMMMRMTAWNAAYKEWRGANPTKVINDVDRRWLLNRADALHGSMTKASTATWQQGVLSVPTMFFSYHARLAELMWGKRLTKMEKLRTMGTLSAIYGVPTALGAPFAVWPFYESIKEGLLQKNVDVDGTVVETLLDGVMPKLFEGIASWGAGKEEDFNFSERYGPGGMTMIRDILRGDKDTLEVVMGASGSIVRDLMVAAEPALQGIYGVFGNDEEAAPLMTEQFVRVAKEISTVLNVTKAVYAWNYGLAVSKNGNILGEGLGGMDAVMMMMGLTPQQISDDFLKLDVTKHLEQTQKAAIPIIADYMKKMFDAAAAGNMEDAEKYQSLARHHYVGAGFQPGEEGKIMDAVAADHGVDFHSNVNYDFWFAKVPEWDREARMKHFLEEGNN